MPFDVLHLVHQSFFGGVAAAGFGLLFNFGLRSLPLCFGMGAFALAIRTLGLDAGWNLEAATFTAAACVTVLADILLRGTRGTARKAAAIIGCIPMVPGAFLAQAILGLFALTAPNPVDAEASIVQAIQALLRVLFTLIALGAGVAIPAHLLKNRDF